MDAVRIGVDVGGTFTDVVLVGDGTVTTAKVPTAADPVDGVIAGVRRACDTADVDPDDVDSFRHATTVAVNALLEGEAAKTALVTTAGFADVIEIGRQARPSLYDIDAAKPEPLVPADRRYEVDERTTPEGIERTIDADEVRELAAELRNDATDDALDAVAICFLHAYAHPENEHRTAALLRDELPVPVVASHEVLPTFREYERTATTVADAALAPVVGSSFDRLADRCDGLGLPTPRVMGANGGIATAEVARDAPITTVLSGPAAGVVGAGAFEPGDADGLIAVDMGGTSTDVSLVRDGRGERTNEAEVAGHPIAIPMVDVTSVGAGGGSVAWVDEGGALRVGPRSAGADPGPACYGRGGDEATLTDAALQLGYLGADATLGGAVELDAGAAEAVLADLARGAGLDGPTAAARGVLRVALVTTTRAVRRVTVERGHDPRSLALGAFGGAGPMIAARLAERLDITRVLVPPCSGVLSAYGLLAADESREAVRTYRGTLDTLDPDAVETAIEALADRAREETTAPNEAAIHREAHLRYEGQSHELTLTVPGSWHDETVREHFEAAHDRERGYVLDEDPVELVALRVRATIESERPAIEHQPSGEARAGERTVHFEQPRKAPIFRRDGLGVDDPVDGPAIVEDGESTLVCPPGWTFHVDDEGTIHLEANA